MSLNPEHEGAQAPNEDPGHRASPTILAQYGFQRAQRRARIVQDVERRKASHELDLLLAIMYPDHTATERSQRWERATANDFVRMGFDPEYVARRYGLTLRTVTA
jgi:hypothetical protein